MRWLALFAVSWALAACDLDVCREHPPAFELEITVDDDVDGTVTDIEVSIEWADQRVKRTYAIGDGLDDGMTSIGVELDPPIAESTKLYVLIVGYDDLGDVIARDDERFDLSPDGCNLFPISLDDIE